MPRTINQVIEVNQGGHDVYTFPLPAKLLIQLARIERFGQDKDGVNRMLNQGHVEEIAVAMSSKAHPVLWLEPIIGDLRGSWIFHDGKLVVGDDASISVDDGQHRVFALQCGLLTEAEIADLVFLVTATKGLPYEMRLRIFRMQTERRQIDARLDLAQRNHLGDWASPLDCEAYQLVLELNATEGSPLFGRIQIDETKLRPYEKGASKEILPNINARGLYSTMRTIIGRRSPLHQLLHFQFQLREHLARARVAHGGVLAGVGLDFRAVDADGAQFRQLQVLRHL